MNKREYDNNRPRQVCPKCGRMITAACFKRHYNACTGEVKKEPEKYILDHDDLFCKFCKKEFKSRNSLIQHEIRCSKNPDKRDHDKLGKYIVQYRKGKNKYNCPEIAKQVKTTLEKYDNGYISAIKGKKRNYDYVYKHHNDAEISKWHSFVQESDVYIPEYKLSCCSEYNRISVNSLPEEYKVKVKSYVAPNGTISEHDFVASCIINKAVEKGNIVHHIDLNGTNNSVYNIIIFKTIGDHVRFHTSNYAYLVYDPETHLFTCSIRRSDERELCNNSYI